MSLKQVKWQFFVTALSFKLAVKVSCNVFVVWTRGSQKVEMKNRRELKAGLAELNEELMMPVLMPYDMVNKVYGEKKSMLSVVIESDKGTKQAGQLQLDLSKHLNSGNKQISLSLPLQKCPDPNAALSFRLRAIPLEDPTKIQLTKSQNKIQKLQQLPSSKSLQSPRIMIRPSTEDASALETDNKKLADQIKFFKKENQALKASVSKNISTVDSFKREIEKMEKQLIGLAEQAKKVKNLKATNSELQDEILKVRLKLATIFNAASQIGGPDLTDQLQSAGGFIQHTPN